MTGLLAKFYLLAGAGVLVGFLAVETRGMVFSGTDGPLSTQSARSVDGRSRSGGGVFFFGSGYRGGK